MYYNKKDFGLTDFEETENLISDCEFNDSLFFFRDDNESTFNAITHSNSERTLKFKNCSFRKGIYLNLISSETFNELTLELIFENCFISNSDEEYNNFININESSSLKFKLSFITCVITQFELERCNFPDLTLIKCILHPNAFVIRECKIPSIYVVNVLGKIFVVDCYHSNLWIHFHDHNFVLEHISINSQIQKIIYREGIKKIYELAGYYNISNVKDTIVRFQKSKESGFKKDHIPIGIGSFNKVVKYYLTDADIKKLNIKLVFDYSKIEKSNLLVEDAILDSIQISGRSESSIKLHTISTNTFYLQNFNTRETQFFNVKSRGIESKFQAVDSELSKVWFNKVRLKSFDKVNFYRTTLEETRFTSTDFPASIESLPNIHYPDKKNEDYYVEQYENYRQLKKTLTSQGNVVQALAMHEKMYDAIEKDKNLDYQDRLILFFNRFSNKHGTSIKHAFLLFLFLIVVLHLLNMAALPFAPYDWGWNGIGPFFTAIKDTLVFSIYNVNKLIILANPTHRVEDLSLTGELDALSTGNYLVSFISRVLIAWAFYQFIMAFRKFGKS